MSYGSRFWDQLNDDVHFVLIFHQRSASLLDYREMSLERVQISFLKHWAWSWPGFNHGQTSGCPIWDKMLEKKVWKKAKLMLNYFLYIFSKFFFSHVKWNNLKMYKFLTNFYYIYIFFMITQIWNNYFSYFFSLVLSWNQIQHKKKVLIYLVF